MKKNFCSILILLASMLQAFACKPIEPEVQIPEGDYINREETLAALEGWVYPVRVEVESKTMAACGGVVEFKKSMDKLLEEVSAVYSVQGINPDGGNSLRFFMTECEEFSGKSADQIAREVETLCSVRIVVNAYAGATDDARGFYFDKSVPVIGHSISGLFNEDSRLYLVRNLGYTRGLVDLLSEEVKSPADNVISSEQYLPGRCILNSDASNARWSDYAKTIINKTGASTKSKSSINYVPQRIDIPVKIQDGGYLDGARIRLYPVANGAVLKNHVEEIWTDKNLLSLNRDIYARYGSYTNFLLECKFGGDFRYAWLPMHELCLEGARGMLAHTVSFEFTQEQYEAAVSIPEDDYVNRQAEFDKLPGWKFRCKVYVEKQTIEDNGGWMNMLKKMDKLLVDASKRFQVPGLNDEGGNQIHFYMTKMVEFEGLERPYRYDTGGVNDMSLDVKIFVNGHPQEGDVTGGWLGAPYLTLGHDFSGLFQGYALDALVHEFGHTRGIPDLYAEKVDADKNPISGESYGSIRCIMNYNYGETLWSEYSKLIINASAGERLCVHEEDYFPKHMSVMVMDASGNPVEGAKLKFYPVKSYSYSVISTPSYSGSTGSDGAYSFTSNPYMFNGGRDHYFNYLIECEYNGAKTYSWWPQHEPQTDMLKGNPDHVKVINLK